MRRYWIEKNQRESDQFLIDKDLLHHVVDVCRHQVGDHFELLCEGHAYFVELIKVEKRQAFARILEERTIAAIPHPRLHLALSIPRFATLESILEKSVEMGVSRILPFFSEFSFVRSKDKITSERFQRWQKIILSATQQTGRGQLMEVANPLPLKDLLGQFKQEEAKGLFAYEGSSNNPIRESIQNLKAPQDLWIFVGSEGGFSKNELKTFEELGMPPCTLGQQVLRVETACLALISVIKYELNLWK